METERDSNSALKDLADMAFIAKKYDDAESKYTAAIGQNSSAELWLKLGLCKTHLCIRLKKTDPSEVTFCLKKAIELNQSLKEEVFESFYSIVSEMIYIGKLSKYSSKLPDFVERLSGKPTETIKDKLENISKSKNLNNILPHNECLIQYDLLESEALEFFKGSKFYVLLSSKIDEGVTEGKRIQENDPLHKLANSFTPNISFNLNDNKENIKSFSQTLLKIIIHSFISLLIWVIIYIVLWFTLLSIEDTPEMIDKATTIGGILLLITIAYIVIHVFKKLKILKKIN